MSEKLDKLRATLKKEQERRIKLNNRIAVLERRIQEEEAAEVSSMVRTANVTPEQLAALLLSAVLCIGMAAPAFAYEGDTAPVEEPVLPEVVEEEDTVTITDEETGALTPEGNLSLVDDYHTSYSDGSGQQFITLVSKSGATFYLVIDRNAKGQQTVHFMNLVDEADLLTLMEEEDAEAVIADIRTAFKMDDLSL